MNTQVLIYLFPDSAPLLFIFYPQRVTIPKEPPSTHGNFDLLLFFILTLALGTF
jgi:hypothetical protein